jgi:hypothetical protein
VHSDDREQTGPPATTHHDLLVVEGLQVALDRRRLGQGPVAGGLLPAYVLVVLGVLEPLVPVGDVLVLPDVLPVPAGVLVEVLPDGVGVLMAPEDPPEPLLDDGSVGDDAEDEPPVWLFVLSAGGGLTPSAASAAADSAPSAIAAAVASGRLGRT